MKLPKRYNPYRAEPALARYWQEHGTYHFDKEDDVRRVYSIDTPPPTVSGKLHLGHVYSYSHADIIARFQRMRGANVFYPMGFDDNGLPTERLVERQEKVHARTIGRTAFVQRCLEVSEKAEEQYRQLWQRLGLSVDWRYTYRTISSEAQREAQLAFIKLYNRGLVYRKQAPTLWCPECETAIAQADLADLERQGWMHTIIFKGKDAAKLRIATTRPELLPACVAVFIHPGDKRHENWVGKEVKVPLFEQWVPVLEDRNADPEKGTGVVMCCTFGDVTDVNWWYVHKLPLRPAIDNTGSMLPIADEFASLSTDEARVRIVEELEVHDLLLDTEKISHAVRVHERCEKPIEYIVTKQWFINVMDYKLELMDIAHQVQWHPPSMEGRIREWIEGLRWDWCISRQRFFGVPFPVWYCKQCGDVRLADIGHLPVDPSEDHPTGACVCGYDDYAPEEDVMDTWATSSLSPQIVGKRLDDKDLYHKVFPFSLRPQAHEIIRTWAFYTLVQSLHRDRIVPWQHAAISGWGLAPEGQGKISKSRGGGSMSPVDMIDLYSADAVRYWASSTGFGKDTVINEERIKAGAKLVTKLYNVARFCVPFLPEEGHPKITTTSELSPADCWILGKMDKCILKTTEYLLNYDYAAAKNEVEAFFWHDLADNYIEMAKLRIYNDHPDIRRGPVYALDAVLLNTLKMLAPFIPYVTETLYQSLYANRCKQDSIHRSSWPECCHAILSDQELTLGEYLVTVATMVRRFKSDYKMSLGQRLTYLRISSSDNMLLTYLQSAEQDLMSVTRAEHIEFNLVSDELKLTHEKLSISIV